MAFSDDDEDFELLTELGFEWESVVEASDHNLMFMINRSTTAPPEVIHLSEDVAVKYGSASCANVFRTLVSAQLKRVFTTGDLRFVGATRMRSKWRVVDTAVLFGLNDHMYCLEPFEILFCFDREFKIFWLTRQDYTNLFGEIIV
jgi:hypothetical protein